MTTTPPPPTTRLGIAIDLDQLRGLMREFIDEQKRDYPEQHETELAFEVFLQWLRQRQRESPDNNILTFRVEKGTGK
jgi:hypothetical protein